MSNTGEQIRQKRPLEGEVANNATGKNSDTGSRHRCDTEGASRPKKKPRSDPSGLPSDPASDASSEIMVLDDHDGDDDDIPYTHRRSASPIALDTSDVEETVRQRSASNTSRNTTPSSGSGASASQGVIIIDDESDSEIHSHEVINIASDDEEDRVESDNDDDDPDQKTVGAQLAEKRNDTSNLHNLMCGVCFESPEQVFMLPCGHHYCNDCIFKSLATMKVSTQTSGPCPMCRTSTAYSKVWPLKLKKARKELSGT